MKIAYPKTIWTLVVLGALSVIVLFMFEAVSTPGPGNVSKKGDDQRMERMFQSYIDGVDTEKIKEILRAHQAKHEWRTEKIPLRDSVSLEGAVMDDNAPHDAKGVYEFNVDGTYVAIFLYHRGGTAQGAHVAYFGSYDDSVNELYNKLRLQIPTSFRGGTAMEFWLGEQIAAEEPTTAGEAN